MGKEDYKKDADQERKLQGEGGGNPNEKDHDPREISRDIPRQPPGDYPTAPPKEQDLGGQTGACVSQSDGACSVPDREAKQFDEPNQSITRESSAI